MSTGHLPGALVCPGCQSVLKPWFAQTPKAPTGQLAVDRCAFCGGLFLQAEVLLVLANVPLHVASPAPSLRRCPHCTVTLVRGRLRGVEVEQCRTCTGLYLDEPELEELAARRVPLRQVEGVEAVRAIRCGACGDKRPVPEMFDEEGTGMVCVNCHGRNDLANVQRAFAERTRRPSDPRDEAPWEKPRTGLTGLLLDFALDALMNVGLPDEDYSSVDIAGSDSGGGFDFGGFD